MRVIAFHRGVRGPEARVRALEDAFAQYCEDNHHRCLRIEGPERGYVNDSELEARYSKLLDEVASMPVLVLIPNAGHLAGNLPLFVERVLALQKLNCDVQCIDSELRDPLQSAILHLGSDKRRKVSAEVNLRIRDKIIRRATEGEVVGRLPYGYRRAVSGRYEIEPHEARVVQRSFLMYAGVDDLGQPLPGGGYGLRRIARTFNSEGLRTRSNRPWSPVTIGNLLRNRAYLGSYQRYGVKIAANHPALVEQELFNFVQQVLSQRQTPPRRTPEQARFMLIGLIKCHLCNEPLKGVSRRRTWQNADGQRMERTYRYYECPIKNVSPEHSSWAAHKVHKQFYGWISSLDRQNATAIIGRYAEHKAKQAQARSALHQRRFLQVVQNVVQGYGSKFDLEDALGSMSGNGNGTGVSHGARPGVVSLDELVERLSADTYTADAQAVAQAIVKSAKAGKRKVSFTARI